MIPPVRQMKRGVALGHALVDDRGVQAGQVERGHGADELQDEHAGQQAVGTGRGRSRSRRISTAASCRGGWRCRAARGRRSARGSVAAPSLSDRVGEREGDGAQQRWPPRPGRIRQPVGDPARAARRQRALSRSLSCGLPGPEVARVRHGGRSRRAWNSANTRRSRSCSTVTAATSRVSRSQRGIDPASSLAGAAGRRRRRRDGVDQRLLGGEDPEDRALGDAGGLGDLPRADARGRSAPAAARSQRSVPRGARPAAGGWLESCGHHNE